MNSSAPLDAPSRDVKHNTWAHFSLGRLEKIPSRVNNERFRINNNCFLPCKANVTSRLGHQNLCFTSLSCQTAGRGSTSPVFLTWLHHHSSSSSSSSRPSKHRKTHKTAELRHRHTRRSPAESLKARCFTVLRYSSVSGLSPRPGRWTVCRISNS